MNPSLGYNFQNTILTILKVIFRPMLYTVQCNFNWTNENNLLLAPLVAVLSKHWQWHTTTIYNFNDINKKPWIQINQLKFLYTQKKTPTTNAAFSFSLDVRFNVKSSIQHSAYVFWKVAILTKLIIKYAVAIFPQC